MGRRSLQIAMAMLAALPVITGTLGLVRGVGGPLYRLAPDCVSPLLDSNYRFLIGVWFGLAVTACRIIPTIERQTTLFRTIWGLIFLGGIGRVISVVTVGPPPPLRVAFLVIEICGAPLFIYWQHRVATASGAAKPLA